VQPDCFNQELRRLKDLIVRPPDHGPAERLKRLLPFDIARRYLVQPMHPAVDLDDQTQPVASEVCVVRPDGMLTAELVSVDLATAQKRPDTLFGAP